ncbi:helix-turn-helix domain-containing protein [Pseudidiomarina aquimaris]|uniref:helix-turn-helix domain-containing protein n=1 Tax=Pseudidiomarina aquimaris TaxID=641841 RepID=UPI003A975018
MLVRKLRLKNGWSQAQLAEMAGVTTRTIQRIERGHPASMETNKALAAVFEVDLSQLQPEDDTMKDDAMKDDATLQHDEQRALQYAKRVKSFYEGLITYLVMAAVFFYFGYDEPLLYWVFGGIGLGLVVQGLIAFEKISFLSPGWEKRLVERKLGRKL